MKSLNMVSHKDKDKEQQQQREEERSQRKREKKESERERETEKEKKAHKSESKSHPVFGEKQIDGGVSNDVHAELEGLDLPGLSWLSNLRHFHGLVVSRQEELPQTVPEKRKELL